MKRLLAILLGTALTISLTACGGGGGGGGGGGDGGTSTLNSIGGPVLQYPYNANALVQGYAIEDGAQLASGTLVRAGTSTSFTAALTALNLVPATSFVNPFFCDNVVVNPSNAMTTGIVILAVSDSVSLFGALLNTTLPANSTSVTTNDKVYYYVLSDRAITATGNCAQGGSSTTIELSLKRGWNRIEGSITLIDGFGRPIAMTWRTTETNANNTWYYADLPPGIAGSSGSSVYSAIDDLVRLSFNID